MAHDHAHDHDDGAHDRDHDADAHRGHDHGPGAHHHAPASFGPAFAVGTALNLAFVVAQVYYGIVSNSVALLADAIHNLGDVLGLIVAWVAMRLALRVPTQTRTYGWGRGTILASLTNAVVLIFGCGAITWEAIGRFNEPEAVGGATVMWVAALGILINGGTALMFLRGRESDLNVKGAFLHMASDAVVSVGVVVAGFLIQRTGWQWLDPVTSLAIVAVIGISTCGLLRDSVNLALDHVPGGIDLAKVRTDLLALPGVSEVHDLHVWALSTTEKALTAHLVRDPSEPAGDLIQQAEALVRKRYHIGHSTFQVETADFATSCPLRPETVV